MIDVLIEVYCQSFSVQIVAGEYKKKSSDAWNCNAREKKILYYF